MWTSSQQLHGPGSFPSPKNTYVRSHASKPLGGPHLDDLRACVPGPSTAKRHTPHPTHDRWTAPPTSQDWLQFPAHPEAGSVRSCPATATGSSNSGSSSGSQHQEPRQRQQQQQQQQVIIIKRACCLTAAGVAADWRGALSPLQAAQAASDNLGHDC
jgi:hypothetical protein